MVEAAGERQMVRVQCSDEQILEVDYEECK